MYRVVSLIVLSALTCANAHAGIIYSGPRNETFTNWSSSSVQNIAGAEFVFGTDWEIAGPPPNWAYFAPKSDDAYVFMNHPQQIGNHKFAESEAIDKPDEYLRGPIEGSGYQATAFFSTWISTLFGNQSEAYTGFVVGSGDDRKVGWAHMTFQWSGSGQYQSLQSVTLTGWAYNDVPGGSITAGQTESATAIPGAGGLVALACGAAGLRRRRNRATTTAETA